MLYPCQCSIWGHERRNVALRVDLPRVFNERLGTHRQTGVSTLARINCKNAQFPHLIFGERQQRRCFIDKRIFCSSKKNTLVTRRVGQLGHKGSLSTPATSIYSIITMYLFDKGFSPLEIFFFGCHPFVFCDIKFTQVPKRRGNPFPRPGFFHSFAGFFSFWSSFLRVSPCLPSPLQPAAVTPSFRQCWVRYCFVSWS